MTTPHLDPAITTNAEAWLKAPYDDETIRSVKQLFDSEQYTELTDSFYKDLEFGTGGLRGIMGVGTNRMNKYTIGRATQGLSNYLRNTYPGRQVKAAISYDSRNNRSEERRVWKGCDRSCKFRWAPKHYKKKTKHKKNSP